VKALVARAEWKGTSGLISFALMQPRARPTPVTREHRLSIDYPFSMTTPAATQASWKTVNPWFRTYPCAWRQTSSSSCWVVSA